MKEMQKPALWQLPERNRKSGCMKREGGIKQTMIEPYRHDVVILSRVKESAPFECC